MVKRVVFMGWSRELPPPEHREMPADDHDILRMVILAENRENGDWVVFRCADWMHAFKVARRIRELGFSVTVKQRGDKLYLRRS